jgi:hypothetical protein
METQKVKTRKNSSMLVKRTHINSARGNNAKKKDEVYNLTNIISQVYTFTKLNEQVFQSSKLGSTLNYDPGGNRE